MAMCMLPLTCTTTLLKNLGLMDTLTAMPLQPNSQRPSHADVYWAGFSIKPQAPGGGSTKMIRHPKSIKSPEGPDEQKCQMWRSTSTSNFGRQQVIPCIPTPIQVSTHPTVAVLAGSVELRQSHTWKMVWRSSSMLLLATTICRAWSTQSTRV